MVSRTNQLDRLIYADIKTIGPEDKLKLSYEEVGFSELETEERLKTLATKGYIRVLETVGDIAVTGISEFGHDFFQSLSAE